MSECLAIGKRWPVEVKLCNGQVVSRQIKIYEYPDKVLAWSLSDIVVALLPQRAKINMSCVLRCEGIEWAAFCGAAGLDFQQGCLIPSVRMLRDRRRRGGSQCDTSRARAIPTVHTVGALFIMLYCATHKRAAVQKEIAKEFPARALQRFWVATDIGVAELLDMCDECADRCDGAGGPGERCQHMHDVLGAVDMHGGQSTPRLICKLMHSCSKEVFVCRAVGAFLQTLVATCATTVTAGVCSSPLPSDPLKEELPPSRPNCKRRIPEEYKKELVLNATKKRRLATGVVTFKQDGFAAKIFRAACEKAGQEQLTAMRRLFKEAQPGTYGISEDAARFGNPGEERIASSITNMNLGSGYMLPQASTIQSWDTWA